MRSFFFQQLRVLLSSQFISFLLDISVHTNCSYQMTSKTVYRNKEHEKKKAQMNAELSQIYLIVRFEEVSYYNYYDNSLYSFFFSDYLN